MTLERMPGLRGERADALDELEERLGAAEPAHPAQHRRGAVLERQVEVGDDAGRLRDGLQQTGSHLGGLQVRHPDPLDALDGG